MTLPIVERLRNPAGFDELLALGHEAADTIDELVMLLRLLRSYPSVRAAIGNRLVAEIDEALAKIGGDA